MINRFFVSLLFVVFSSCFCFSATLADSLLCTVNGDVNEMMVHVRAQGKEWSLLWDYLDDANYRAATIKMLSVSGSDDFFNNTSQVTISKVEQGAVVAEKKVNVSHAGMIASLKLEVKDNNLRVYAGDGMRCVIGDDLARFDGLQGSKVILRQNQLMKSVSVYKSVNYRVAATYSTYRTVGELSEHIAMSNDSIEGFWRYLDREMDEPTVVPGGYYQLATVKRGDRYDILYVCGADKYSSLWTPLQVKGTLHATIFRDNFDLEWIDSKRICTLSRDVYVTFEQNSIMSVHFPLLKSVIRFSRMKR
jgi:hypothetical protein